MPCNIIPDNGLLSPEYAMEFTIPAFKKKILLHWEKNHFGDKNYVNKKFELFCSCIQGIAADKWDLCALK